MLNKPVFWRCGGGSLPYNWGYGYWTGIDKDLLCVKPNIKMHANEAEEWLSPICSSKKLAKEAFNKVRNNYKISSHCRICKSMKCERG